VGVGGGEPWYSSYDTGLELIESQEYAAARSALQEALISRPEEGLKVRTYGVRYVDYLPNLYLAVAAYHAGDTEAARDHLADADASGIAVRSSAGSTLLENYRDLVAGAEGNRDQKRDREPSEGRLVGLRSTDRQPGVLSEDEVQALKRRTLVRCGLDDGVPVRAAPWYFHYEMGLELSQRGDPQRAVDFLMAAAERRPLPSRYARMYGMWFTNYRPYIELAENHVELGNWECAFNALTLSRETGEMAAGGDDLIGKYRALLQECEQKLGDAGGRR